jgi:hypothetical protein
MWQGALNVAGSNTQAALGRETFESDDSHHVDEHVNDTKFGAGLTGTGFDTVVVEGGYGDYRDFESVDREVVDAKTAKALSDAAKSKALADLWARLGGPNSCGLPVDASALAQGMSLLEINGGAPVGSSVAGWGE